jgi:hypothetical protein
MVCHSKEFVLSVLLEKDYFARLSDYMIEQMSSLGPNDFPRLIRSIDAMEGGHPSTRNPGDFRENGQLKGYGHFHYMKEDWAATNLAAISGQPIMQSLDATIDHVAEKIVATGGDFEAALEQKLRKFLLRTRNASGDWVLYRDGPNGREYLAINPHVQPGSEEEQALSRLLDRIAGGESGLAAKSLRAK